MVGHTYGCCFLSDAYAHMVHMHAHMHTLHINFASVLSLGWPPGSSESHLSELRIGAERDSVSLLAAVLFLDTVPLVSVSTMYIAHPKSLPMA